MALRGESTIAVGTAASIRLLVAACGPYVMAFPADWVRGILMPAEAGRAHTVVSAGILYPFTNLAERLRVSISPETVETRVILYGTGACRRAFMVDQIFEMVDVTRPALHALPRHFRSEERSRLSGYIVYRDSLGFVVNPLWLLEASSHGQALTSDPNETAGERLTIAYAEAQPASVAPAMKQLN